MTSFVLPCLSPQQVLGHSRNDRPGKDIRGQHRENHRLSKRHEEVSRDAGQQEHRSKSNTTPSKSFSGSASRFRLMFSTSTVASSTRMPTAKASPPRVMMLIVCPSTLRTMMDVRIAKGIEVAMISVLRQLPRKTRIIKAVRHAAIRVSLTTPLIAPRTNID